jgi:O-glycosyl hydrolase
MFYFTSFKKPKIPHRKNSVIVTLLSALLMTTAQANEASVVVTQGNTEALLSQQSNLNFVDGTSNQPQAITIDSAQTFQTIDGLGFALTEASTAAIAQLPSNQQDALLQELFSVDNGNGISMVRISIGASDLSTSLYTYNEANTSDNNFIPQANSTYYIDNPAQGLRLGALVNGEEPYTAGNSPTGADFEWQFIPAGEGYWYIQRAAGGDTPRLRTNDTNMADLSIATSDGTWEKFALSTGEGDGRYFLSLPLKGFGNHDRLQIDNDGLVRMVDNDQSAGTWESFTFTEVSTSNSFSLAGPDLQTLVPILQKIRAINPNIKILGTPWTAPRWMKTNNDWVGGELKPENYEDFAQYFLQYLQAMAALNLNIWGITVQNEPENDHNEPSMVMTATQQYQFINDHLGPLLASSSQSAVKILGFDHNLDNIDFPIEVAQSQYVEGSAFHLYAGNINAMGTVAEATSKSVYLTEQFTGIPTGNTEAELVAAFDQDLSWHLENVVIGSIRNGSKAVLEWNLVTSPPTTSVGCVVCLGAITIEQGNNMSRNVSYYIISQLSSALQAGAVRIDSGQISGDLHHVAFTNPDESTVVLMYNAANTAINTGINWQGSYVNYTIPARSAATIKWAATTVIPTDIKVEAEDFVSMNGIQLEATTDDGGGQNVGWIDNNDSLTYEANITASGYYDIAYRIASTATASLTLQQGNNSFPVQSIPNTGDWQNWQTVSQTVFLIAGIQPLTVTANASNWNLNWFALTPTEEPNNGDDGDSNNNDNNDNNTTDSDNDGVFDNLDNCPNTTANKAVDANGCEISTSSCDGVNAYPNWTSKDWEAGDFNHNEADDLMSYQGNVYAANWYTNSIPGSDNTWRFIRSCQ